MKRPSIFTSWPHIWEHPFSARSYHTEHELRRRYDGRYNHPVDQLLSNELPFWLAIGPICWEYSL